MADNVVLNSGTGGATAAGAELSISGDTAIVQMVGIGILSGSEGAWTLSQVTGNAGAADAGTQRVVLASDDPGVVLLGTIDTDTSTIAGAVSGSEMQVDVVAALPAGTNAIGKLAANDGVDIGDVTVNNTVTVDLGANNDVTIDNSSIVKAEDAIHNSGDAGVMALAVRNDTLAALAGTDGDYAPLQVNASGALFIQEGSALDVSAATVTVDLGANNDVTIDGSSIVHAEDAIHNTGDAGVMSLAVRNDTLAALAGTDGDYAPLQVNASGALFVDGSDVTQPISAASLPLPSGAATAANQSTANTALSAIQTAVEILDDWDETNRAAVNLIASQVGVTGGAGAVAANTPRITLASDDPAVVALQVIDDWDETNRCAVNLISGQVGVAGGTGTDGATTLRVTLATDVALPAGTNAIGTVGHNTTGLGHGVKTVAVAGTDEVLAGSTAAKWVILTAQTDNTDLVAVGASGVDATEATGNGIPLYPGDSVTIPCDNLDDIYVDALVSGEGVRYAYGT